MEKLTANDAYTLLFDYPVAIGRAYGFNKLTDDIHNKWLVRMITATEDETLQGHRGSYKTTCLSVALAILVVACPYLKILFVRKTDDDVKEIVAQTKKILLSEIMQAIVFTLYGFNLELVTDSATELSTNLAKSDARGTNQLVAVGIGGSLTGKHFDVIFTDDIVNVKDRTSKAERERTKVFYQELQNIKNRGGRIFNTGTPWHINDAFELMPKATTYDCYSTELISEKELANIKERMTASLFSANYELRHIASDKVIFFNPQFTDDISLVEQGNCHIDASYGGEDYTAFTICHKVNDKYYVLGKLWQKHVDDVEDEIIGLRKLYNAGRISCETNGDKGYLAKDLRKRGERTHAYHEDMNKYLKITSYLKAEWLNVVFIKGTDKEYIQQILDYTEEAEHDDAPDSLACMVRELWRKQPPKDNSHNYFL